MHLASLMPALFFVILAKVLRLIRLDAVLASI